MGFFYAMQNTGQILRSKKTGKSRYTPISNEILQSSELTPEEKSILVHLLSLPEDWVVYKGIIWRNMNMGRDRFNKNWKGLVDKGYIVSIRVIDTETNLIKGWNHIVYEEPVLSEFTELPNDQDSDLLNFSHSENQSVYKEIKEQKNKITKDIFIIPTVEELQNEFPNLDSQRFHDFYSSKGWMVGKNKMKDWKAAARNWLSNNKKDNFANKSYSKLNLND
jgi:hypothetical protein